MQSDDKKTLAVSWSTLSLIGPTAVPFFCFNTNTEGYEFITRMFASRHPQLLNGHWTVFCGGQRNSNHDFVRSVLATDATNL